MGDTAVNSMLSALHQSNENGNIKISSLFKKKKKLFSGSVQWRSLEIMTPHRVALTLSDIQI